MRFGLTDAQLAEITAILQKYPEVSRGLIFGSRAMGNYGEASDIDLAIKGKDVTFKTQVNISGDLEDSELPFLCDVVNYHTIDHPPFKEHIDTEGVTFYRHGWQEMYLDDAVEINPTVKILKGELCPYVDMQMLVPENKIVETTQTKIFNGGGSRFVDGDTLMARITPCLENGKISRFKAKGQFPTHGSTEFIVMRNKDKITHPDFVYYLIASHQVKPYAIAQMTGSSGRQRVPTSKFKTIRVKLPPIKQQEAISTSLGVLDDKIELNKSINTTLENMADAIFKSWFVDFDPVHAKQLAREASLPLDRAAMAVIAALCSPSEFVENFAAMDKALTKKLASMSSTERDTLTHTAALFPDEFEESEMGAIPRGWDVGKLGDEFNVTMGQSPKGETYNEAGQGTAFFQGRTDFGFRFPTIRVFTTDPKRMARAGDTLISVRAPVGDKNMAIEDCCVGRGLAALRHKSDSVSYTYYLISQIEGSLDSLAGSGTVFSSLSKDGLSGVKIIAPSKEIVKKFSDLVSPIDEAIATQSIETKNLSNLRDTLLPKLINGDIDVSAIT